MRNNGLYATLQFYKRLLSTRHALCSSCLTKTSNTSKAKLPAGILTPNILITNTYSDLTNRHAADFTFVFHTSHRTPS